MAIGKKVYIDSLYAGLVPGVIVGRESSVSRGSYCVRVKVTADRGAYRRGEVVSIVSHRAVPRDAVRRRGGRYVIRPFSHNWETIVIRDEAVRPVDTNFIR